jgi:hypothetical protein
MRFSSPTCYVKILTANPLLIKRECKERFMSDECAERFVSFVQKMRILASCCVDMVGVHFMMVDEP